MVSVVVIAICNCVIVIVIERPIPDVIGCNCFPVIA